MYIGRTHMDFSKESLASFPLARLADQIGTPFYLYDGHVLKQRLAGLKARTEGPDLQARYAMKANSSWKVLEAVREAGFWIDAVSGNEVLRARRAGFATGAEPPVVMLSADVFRDNALTALLEHRVLPNIGSPGMIEELQGAGYRGPIAVRVNPGFGHGHVGTGPQIREFDANMRRLVDAFVDLLPRFPDVQAVNLGGGIPHPYRPEAQAYDLAWYRPVLVEATQKFAAAPGRRIRVEIEPGRYGVDGMAILVARVKDLKRARANARGEGREFVMVDAGIADLVRPAMYGSYHTISLVGAGAARPAQPYVVAGPLCERGAVFTRDAQELLVPRSFGRPD